MYETSKAVMRRLHDSRFAMRYIVGNGLDIGSGSDPLSNYAEQFCLMTNCRDWDLNDGDAQLLESIDDASLDFVHSSHCLEHMCDPREALANWLRVLKPGGHLIVTIPDEDLYEQGVFPSTWNPDHMWTFTMHKVRSWSEKSINLLSLLTEFSEYAKVIKVEQLDASYRYSQQVRYDQTLTPFAECALEFILRKLTSEEQVRCGRFPEQTSAPVPVLSLSDSLSLAMDHHRNGRFPEAEAIYRKILGRDSGSSEIYKNLGNTLLALGRLAEAEEVYRQALCIKPDYGEAYNNLGNVLCLAKRFDDAEDAFRQAFALMPGRAEVHNNFGNVLLASGRIDEAEKAYRKAIVLNPEYFQAYANRGYTLRILGRRDAALKSYQQAIDLKPDYAEAYAGLGQTLNHLGRLEEAEQAHRQAIAMKPDCAEAYNGLANVLMDLGRLEQAELYYFKALAIKPDDASAIFSASLLNLMLGRYEKGFKGFESRFDGGSPGSFRNIKEQFKKLHYQKRWNGESMVNRSLLLLTEQGAGDSLMMIRYIHLLKQFHPQCLIVYCSAELQRLFEAVPGVFQAIPWTEPLPLDGIDLYCPIMSLPNVFQTDLQTVPANVPYLSVPDSIRKKWRDRLGQYDGLKVGLVWAGNSQFILDNVRSIPLEEFTPLLGVEGVHMFSLQKDGSHSLLHSRDGRITDWMDECADFLDTAALVDELDLVVSVDTAVAHLAGALGKQVWLLNRAGSEWRWMLDREDSPWYPTMRIFRQHERGDWASVLLRVVDELTRLTLLQKSEQNSVSRSPSLRSSP